MVKALRLMKIKEILSEKGAIDTQTLSDLAGVSSVTIRSDLIHLEQEGFLFRTYGGAVLREQPTSSKSPSIPLPSGGSALQLAELGAVVAKHVTQNNWILLGFGSTCREVAKHLLNHNIKVVTGNIDASVILGDSKTVEVLIPGGYLRKQRDYLLLHGEWYLKSISSLSVNQAYISVAGIDAAGFTVGDALECQTLDLVRKIAREVVVVSDSSKFDQTSFFRVGGFDYADTVITNNDIPDKYRELLRLNDVNVITPSSQL